LVDRLKDMIIRGGENVYCSEVEAVLARIPEVDEAAVFGVPDPDLGERVEGVVRLVEGADVDAQALLRALDGKLARYKIPDRIYVLGEPLPRNATGKLLKGEIRALVSMEK
jgi:acyl-CoA synthetase (AMP-forming)/AMP-acid ligase II